MRKQLFFCLSGLFLATHLFAQAPVTITFVDEDTLHFSFSFKNQIETEILALLESRRPVNFKSIYLSELEAESTRQIEALYSEEETDIIIGLGLKNSMLLAQKPSYSKPTISSIIIDRALQGLSVTPEGGSGIPNFAYVESPFNIQKDLELFHQLYPYKHLGLLIDNDLSGFPSILNNFFNNRIQQGVSFEFINARNTVEQTLNAIPEKVDALYVLTVSQFSPDEFRTFFHEINHNGIPAFALTGRDLVRLGALAGLASQNYFPTLARRLALDVMNILEGVNASELPVEIDTREEDFVINMTALQHLKIYPDFDLLNKAILLNLEQTSSELEWSIETLIYESLKTNLGLKAGEKDIALANEDIKIAKSNYQPQVEVSSSGVWLDQKTVDHAMGQAAQFSWTAKAELNQLIFSEPALANIAVQKLLNESQNAAFDEIKLDLILESAQAYLSFLQTKSFVRIQNENVDVTNKNLNISRSKEQLGYSGISDVYRLEAQLAQNIIDLNDAVASNRQTRININRIINHPLEEEFNTVDVKRNSMISMAGDERLENLINNQRDLDQLTRFLVEEAFKNLPELRQIELAIKSQNRLLQSNQRSFYSPELGVNASWEKPIGYWGELEIPGFDGLPTNRQWVAAGKISLPIFQGGSRKAQIQKNKVAIAQLQDQKQNLKNGLEASLRSGMEVLSASYQRVELARNSANAARKNFNIIQDLYRQGEVDIITLVDAQNASLSAALNATNAVYQLISDFLFVERGTGKFYFLMSDSEKLSFVERLNTFLIKREK